MVLHAFKKIGIKCNFFITQLFQQSSEIALIHHFIAVVGWMDRMPDGLKLKNIVRFSADITLFRIRKSGTEIFCESPYSTNLRQGSDMSPKLCCEYICHQFGTASINKATETELIPIWSQQRRFISL